MIKSLLRKLLLSIAVSAVLALALVGARASANASSASISFAGTATLVTNPGPANVTLHYSCLPPNPGFVEAELGENAVVGVSPMTPATCDGKTHSVTLTVPGAFTPGTASGIGIVESGNGTSFATTNAKVTIK